MRVAIIDDDKYWRECAECVVRQCFADEVLDIDSYESGEKYLKDGNYYDISFVDIEMQGIDGFDTIVKAKEYNRDGVFIILTTHLEMSRKGFKVDALRYVDKADIEEELKEAIIAAKLHLGRNEKITLDVAGQGTREVILKDIIYIETEKPYIVVHTTYGNIKCKNHMMDIENILNGKWFFRCHNSYIVNLDEVKNIKGTIVYLKNGDDIDVSQRKIWDFKRAYVNRQFERGSA